MGWATGSYLAQDIWDRIRHFIPRDERKAEANWLFEKFADEDADDWDSDSALCREAVRYQEGEE